MSVFDIRLRVSDPPGFIAFIEIATTGDLPAIPANQTAYLVTADGNYYATDKLTGAVLADYSIQELLVSDARIQNWIDLSGEDYATCQAIDAIKPQLLAKMQLVRNGTGAELVQYQTLRDTYNYLKELSIECKDIKKSNENNSTGRMGGSKAPTIGGGDI